MKVCLIGDGRSIHLKRWALSLKQGGLDVCTYFTYQAPDFAGIPNYQFSYDKRPLFNSKWRHQKFLDFLQSIDADIYHVHFLVYTSLINELIKMENLVATPYGSEIFWHLSFRKSRIKRLLIENAKLITTSSKFLLNKIIEQGYEPVNQKIIYFGVDRNQFKPVRNVTSVDFRIGYVKHLVGYYGIEYLIQAVEIILRQRNDIQLHIYGDGPLKERLNEYVVSNELYRNIFLHGSIEHDQLPEIYNQFDVFVMPSVCEEAFGVAAVEAQACGVPVIASNIGGVPEAVSDGKTGILVKPGVVDEIVQAIEKLLNDKPLRAKMSKNAVEWSRNFDWNESVSEMIEAYQSLV